MPQEKTPPHAPPCRSCFTHGVSMLLSGPVLGGKRKRKKKKTPRGCAYIDEEAKGGPPANADDDVDRPVDKGGGERDQPNEREEDGDAGHHLGVDEAAESPRVGIRLVQELAIDARDDGGKGELRAAKQEADEAIQGHDDQRSCKWQ